MSSTANRMVSGTPVAAVVDDPKLDRMSRLTTPLWVRMSGPFDPSPGYGPAVSSGIATSQAAPAVMLDALAEAAGVLPGDPVARDAAPGVHAAIVRLAPATPRSLIAWRRVRRVWTSKARPWSQAGSVGSGSTRPSKVGTGSWRSLAGVFFTGATP